MTAVFTSSLQAQRARFRLRRLGLSRPQVTLLTPRSSAAEIDATPTSEGEQPGMGKTLGGLVGAAFGLWSGALLTVLPDYWLAYSVPQIVLMAAGVFAGSTCGVFAGGVLEDFLTRGLPRDELSYYLHALKNDRAVIIVCARRRRELMASRQVLTRSGALVLDPARKATWIGIRCVAAFTLE